MKKYHKGKKEVLTVTLVMFALRWPHRQLVAQLTAKRVKGGGLMKIFFCDSRGEFAELSATELQSF